MNQLLTTLLDLDAELGGNAGLCVGGGFGLYLKQLHYQEHPGRRTLFPWEDLPSARTTEDIDIFLRGEVVADANHMLQIRAALDALGFEVIDSAKYMQFVRPMPPGHVKIDLLVGPLGSFAKHTHRDARRVRPKGKSVKLHARRVDEAVAIESKPLVLPIRGRRSTGANHATEVLIPQTFSYLLMKLTAFRDQSRDQTKDYGRHHAMDVYRAVGLLTRDEDAVVRTLCDRHRHDSAVVEAGDIVREYFGNPDAMGLLRIREHSLFSTRLRLQELCEQLRDIFAVAS